MLNKEEPRRRLKAAIITYVITIYSLGAAAYLAAQPDEPPIGRRTESDRQTTYVPPGAVLERRFFDSTGWIFYHSIDDLPADLRALLFRVAGSSVVGPGESFNTGDTKDYPSSSQHQYTAATADLSVVVWYGASFSGPMLHAMFYDRTAHDACRYAFLTTSGSVPPKPMLTSLLSLIKEKQSPGSKCQYSPAGAL